jgi:3-dehydroquinate synthetase
MKNLRYSIIQTQSTEISFEGKIDLSNYQKVIYVVDEQLKDHTSFPNSIFLKVDENTKNLEQLDKVLQLFISHELDRNSLVFAVGGGSLSDLVGFAASIYMRGVSFGIYPSTLLSAVDACLGGKNGIDYQGYKNILGRIEQPKYIVYDLNVLQHLPYEEFKNGFAEIIKYGCANQVELFHLLERYQIEDFYKNEDLLREVLYQSAQIKLDIIQQDPFEQGIRKLLNFGHTIGHAIEKRWKLRHGEAVASGIYYILLYAVHYENFPKETFEKVELLIQKYGFEVVDFYQMQSALALIQMDKKRTNQKIDIVLLEKLGKGHIKRLELGQFLVNLSQLKNEKNNYSVH